MKKEFIYFIKHNKIITFMQLVATLVIVLYILATSYNIPELWNNAGFQFGVIYQISLSITASFIFYIIQVYIPERKKKKTISPYINRLVKKITSDMDVIIRELSKCYLKKRYLIIRYYRRRIQGYYSKLLYI